MVAAAVVNTGTQANDATGDLLRDAFTKINNNFAALFAGNFPAAQMTIGPPVSGTTLTVIGLAGQSAITTSIGTVTIGSPTSGVALTVNGVGSTRTAQFAAAAGGPVSIGLLDGQAGTTQWSLAVGISSAGNFEIINNTAGTTPVKIVPSGGITLPAPTATVATLAISGASGAACITATAFSGTDTALTAIGNVVLGTGTSSVTLHGNVTMSAPTAGTTLAITGLANSNTMTIAAPNTSGQSFGQIITAGTTSGDICVRYLNAAGSATLFEIFGDGHGTLGPSSSLGLSWSTVGGMVVAAPSSGDALIVTNVAGGNALTLNGNSAGTAVLKLNTQATTGAQTATFAASNKPGSGTTGPDKWIPINLDGTTHYVPAFL